MELVKVKDKRNGVIKEVKKSLAGDYIGTGNFEVLEEKKETKKPELKSRFSKEEYDVKNRM